MGAYGERGQISRIAELNSNGCCWRYDESSHSLERSENGERWTSAVLGGARRIAELRTLLTELRAAHVTVTVITKGLVGAVRAILDAEQLLHFFSKVYGNIGSEYGSTEYDKAKKGNESPYEGTQDCKILLTKAVVIKSIMKQAELSKDEAVLVEDDKMEIESVVGICRGVYIARQRGMLTEEMDRIRDLAQLPKTAANELLNVIDVSTVTANAENKLSNKASHKEDEATATPDAK